MTWFGAVFTVQVIGVYLYQQRGSQTGAGRGPNQMPRHVLSNLDTSLKTLSYFPLLKNVEL